MAPPRSWTPSEERVLARLHREGLSLREIAKRMSRSADTISRHAAQAGLSFDRSVTVAATLATTVDAKARRAALGIAMLADLETARLRIGVSESAREFQATTQGIDALMRAYVNLLRQEPGDGGLGEAQGIVGVILAAVRGSVDGLPRLNPTAPSAEVGAK